MKNLIWLVVTAASLSGCSFLRFKELPDLNPDATYRHELTLDINSSRVVGVGVVPRADEYKVRVYPPGKVDRIAWRTCSMEQIIDKPDVQKSGWLNGYNYVDFVYRPAIGLDDVNSCALKIEVLEEKKRRNGMALIEFTIAREEISLMGDLLCNGVFSQPRGVSICQSAAGLKQKIVFPQPVIQIDLEEDSPRCKGTMFPLKGDKTTYLFNMPQGECIYTFVSQSRTPNGKRIQHRLTTVGYTDVPPIK